jgi:hypothetical protein
MNDLDNKIKVWMESLGYEHFGYDCDELGGYFCIVKDGKRSVTFMNHIDYSAAKQLYLNPPLDSPAVRQAIKEAVMAVEGEKDLDWSRHERQAVERAVLEAKKELVENMRIYSNNEDLLKNASRVRIDLLDGAGHRSLKNAIDELDWRLKELEDL